MRSNFKIPTLSSDFRTLNINQARFEGKEYVLTQPDTTDWDSDDLKDILAAEYKLLCQGDALKTHFDQYADELGVKGIPGAYTHISAQALPSGPTLMQTGRILF